MNKMLTPSSLEQQSADSVMPDVASSESAGILSTLDWVGMSEIALPFAVEDLDDGAVVCQGKAQAYVNICEPEVKGIHMSRLYLLLEQWAEAETVTPRALQQLLQQKLDSHTDISDSTSLSLRFEYLSRRPALKSAHKGWKAYPAEIVATTKQGRFELELKLSIPYSSTCPCSASLSRQLLDQAFAEDFAGTEVISKQDISAWLLSARGSVATPHSQRSWAYLRMKLDHQVLADGFPLSRLVDAVEDVLKTPVQTAVKREDEQAFARLNGENLMFCEDAARRVKAALLAQDEVSDFWLKVEHQESLHAHNAVAIATRGLADGYRAELVF